MKPKPILIALVLAALAVPATAAVTITVDIGSFSPDIGTNNGTIVIAGSSNNGTFVSNGTNLATQSFTLTNVDLTAIGGTASQTINFTINFTATGGTVQQSFGYLDVGTSAGISTTESISGALGLISSDFAGGSVAFAGLSAVNFSAFISGETANINHDGGTIAAAGPTSSYAFAPSSTFTVAPTSGALGLIGYQVQITAAVPEPSGPSLIGLAGLTVLLRRRR